jgi:hypothetical protein
MSIILFLTNTLPHGRIQITRESPSGKASAFQADMRGFESRLPLLLAVSYQLRADRQKGPVAQWLAQATHNRLVAGSNPAGPTFALSGFFTLLWGWLIFFRIDYEYKAKVKNEFH